MKTKRNAQGFYPINGKSFISVTTLLGNMLGAPKGLVDGQMYRAQKCGVAEVNRLDEISRDIGRKFHKNAYSVIINNKRCKSLYKNRMGYIHDFISTNELIPKGGEDDVIVYDEVLEVAGSPDLILENDRLQEIYILDYKTGRENRFKEVLQLSKYLTMFVALNPKYKDYTKFGVLAYVGKTDDTIPKFRVFPNDIIERGKLCFNVLCGCHSFKTKMNTYFKKNKKED